MKRNLALAGVIASAVLLAATSLNAQTLGFCVVGFQCVQVPEIDFQNLGPLGIGTAIMTVGYAVRKAHQKINGRKRA